MRTIAVVNQKGGCGKTTIAVNLSCALSRCEKRVLMVDIDPQAHASLGFGIEGDRLEMTMYELLMDPFTNINDAIVRRTDTLSIVAASTVLGGVEQELSEINGREQRLAQALDRLDQNSFDTVIIDCPPSIGLLTFNALVASDEVLIPIDASYFSFQGLIKQRETLKVIEEETGHRPHVHIVCNNMDTRTRFSNHLLAEIEKFHSGAITEAFISSTVRLKECAALGISIFEMDESCKASMQFLSLARELIVKEPKRRRKRSKVRSENPRGPQKVPEGVLFVLDAPQASFVTVTGDFTDWSQDGIPLKRNAENGLWKAVVDIEPGRYEYRFIIDGVWEPDPANALTAPNEFGQKNSLIVV